MQLKELLLALLGIVPLTLLVHGCFGLFLVQEAYLKVTRVDKFIFLFKFHRTKFQIVRINKNNKYGGEMLNNLCLLSKFDILISALIQ